MPTMTRGERIVRSVLFTSVALVSVMAIGIGYQQQTVGGIRAMSAQDKAPAEEMPVDVGNSYQPVKEPTAATTTMPATPISTPALPPAPARP